MTPEQAVRKYLSLKERCQTVRGMNPFVSHGIVPKVTRCKQCKAHKNSAIRSPAGIICNRCGHHFPTKEVVVVKGQVDITRRPGSYDSSLVDLCTLSMILSRAESRNCWAHRTFLLYAGEQVGGERIVAEEARKRWPLASVKWNRHVVRQLLPIGRKILSQELDAVGLLSLS